MKHREKNDEIQGSFKSLSIYVIGVAEGKAEKTKILEGGVTAKNVIPDESYKPIYINFVLFLLKICLFLLKDLQREVESEKDLPSTGSLLQWPQWSEQN